MEARELTFTPAFSHSNKMNTDVVRKERSLNLKNQPRVKQLHNQQQPKLIMNASKSQDKIRRINKNMLQSYKPQIVKERGSVKSAQRKGQ